MRQWVFFRDKGGAGFQPAGEGTTTTDKLPIPLAEIVADPKGPFALPKDAEQYYPAAVMAELKQLREATTAAEKAVPKLPMVMGASEGKPANLKIHLRGNYLTQDREVPRQFLQIIAGRAADADRRRPQRPAGAGRTG